MKKTLAAVAVLGAFAGSALAADVTLYGRIDTGLNFTSNTIEEDGVERVDTQDWGMASGQTSGSRLGVKGTEQISEGLAVGFVLEHGLSSDTGANGDGSRFFNRESMVQIISDYGTFAFGRMGTINSDAGTFGFYSGAVNPFGTGWNALPGVGGSLFAAPSARMDNVITYKSPTFAGTTVYAQYSTGADSTKDGFEENSNKFDRYAALGVNYANGGLNLAAVVDWVDEAKAAGAKDPEDMYTINVGGSYNCGFAKTYLAAQYFKNANDFGGMSAMYNAAGFKEENNAGEMVDWKWANEKYDEIKGYGVALGFDIPAFGGNFLASLGYSDAENETAGTEKFDAKVYSVAAAYTYPLSSRTNLYLTGVYNNREMKETGWKLEQEEYKVTTGILHKF